MFRLQHSLKCGSGGTQLLTWNDSHRIYSTMYSVFHNNASSTHSLPPHYNGKSPSCILLVCYEIGAPPVYVQENSWWMVCLLGGDCTKGTISFFTKAHTEVRHEVASRHPRLGRQKVTMRWTLTSLAKRWGLMHHSTPNNPHLLIWWCGECVYSLAYGFWQVTWYDYDWGGLVGP